jgi:hypothetical protein
MIDFEALYKKTCEDSLEKSLAGLSNGFLHLRSLLSSFEVEEKDLSDIVSFLSYIKGLCTACTEEIDNRMEKEEDVQENE